MGISQESLSSENVMGHSQHPPLEHGKIPPEKPEDKLAQKANDSLQSDVAKQWFEVLNSEVVQQNQQEKLDRNVTLDQQLQNGKAKMTPITRQFGCSIELKDGDQVVVKGRSSGEVSRAKEADAGKTYTPKEQQLLAEMLQASSEGKLIGVAGKFVGRPAQGNNGSDELTGQPQEKPVLVAYENDTASDITPIPGQVPEGISKAEYATAVKQLEAKQQEQVPIAVIAQGLEANQQQLMSDGGGKPVESVKAPGPDDVIAQIRPDKAAAHEGVMTGVGHLHGAVNFATNTLIGLGDTLRMAGAAERKIDPFQIGQKDTDPEGTKKLHETCQGLTMGSRVLLQYSTTLNKESPFYGKDFDPEARQVAEKLAPMLKDEVSKWKTEYKNSDPEARAAKSTELILNIYTFAEAGGMVLTKAGQIAKESKALSQISKDMHTFASNLKEHPHSDKLTKMTEYLDANMPKFGPELAAEGPSLKQSNATKHEAEDQALKMVKHSDRGKGHDRGGDKARESKKLDEMREAHRITQERWAETNEKKIVKYLRDKGEVIDKNKLEGTFPDDSPYRRQTDGMQWELKSISKVEKSKNIVDAIAAHAKDGAEKFTGKEHLGRVLIDAREQRWMSEKLAETGMKEAFRRSPDLQEIRLIGKDQHTGKHFDIGLKRGQKEVTRR